MIVQEKSLHSPIAGEVRYHRNLSYPGLRDPRDVIVWLPPSYSKNPNHRYPVLYAHDGQNLFDPATAFLGQAWRLDLVADGMMRSGKIQEFLIVGIYNTPDRLLEYSGSRKGRTFADFVALELKPMIDNNYRTDVSSSAVLGSSMGGLASFLSSWWYPEVFSQSACMSTSFFWNNSRVVNEVRYDQGRKKPIRIYLDVGSRETRLRPGYHEMIAALKEKGFRKGTDLEHFFARGADHNERFWVNRVWRPLTFLFGR